VGGSSPNLLYKGLSTPVAENGDFVAVFGDYSFGNKVAVSGYFSATGVDRP